MIVTFITIPGFIGGPGGPTPTRRVIPSWTLTCGPAPTLLTSMTSSARPTTYPQAVQHSAPIA